MRRLAPGAAAAVDRLVVKGQSSLQVRGGKWKKFVLDEICFLQLQGLQVSTPQGLERQQKTEARTLGNKARLGAQRLAPPLLLALDLRGAAMPYVGKEYVQTCMRSHAGPYSIAEREEIERRRKKLNSGRMLSDEQLLQICDPGPTTEETEKMLAHN